MTRRMRNKSVTRWRRVWDSLGDFIRFAEEGYQPYFTAGKNPGEIWGGGIGFGDACQLARQGWAPEGRKVSDMVESIQTVVRETTTLTVRYEHGVMGGVVDIPAYLSGDPECMMQPIFEDGPAIGHHAVLVVNTGALADVSTDLYLARGAAICAVVEILAELGTNVELWAGSRCREVNDRDWQGLVCIKPAEDPIDIHAVAFCLAHPAWHRRLTFAARETDMGSGYVGGSMELDLADFTHTAHIPRITAGETYGVAWVLDVLERCGVEIHRG